MPGLPEVTSVRGFVQDRVSLRKIKIFISSVQAEFAHERSELQEYLLSDPLLGKFFEPFIFEQLPAIDQRADAIYLKEAASIHSG